MNSSFYRFILDVQTAQSQISIPVSLGDTAITLYISLTDGGKPYIMETGCLAKLSITRPSGSKLHEFCAIEGNHSAVYPFSQNPATASEEGIHECELTVYGRNNEQLTASRFSIIFNERVVNMDDNNCITDEHIGIIDDMIHSEQVRRTGEEARLEAEAVRVSSENGRVSAETERAAAEEARTANYERIDHDTAESVRKILAEQESILAIQNSLLERGEIQSGLAEIITQQQNYIGGSGS